MWKREASLEKLGQVSCYVVLCVMKNVGVLNGHMHQRDFCVVLELAYL